VREDIGAAIDFNKCLHLHYRQRLSVNELFCMIQNHAGHGYLFFFKSFYHKSSLSLLIRFELIKMMLIEGYNLKDEQF
jgi:hypothetical protein